jgi:RNA polymerase sigma factor (TIGR02999 family)
VLRFVLSSPVVSTEPAEKSGHVSGIACRREQLQARGMGELTRLLAAARNGETGAVDQIVVLTYHELRDLAHQRLRRVPKITLLDTGVLVNECYLRLVKVGELNAGDKAHFLGYAGRVMRSIVVDFARERLAQRRGGNIPHVEAGPDIPDPAAAAEEEVVRVDEALQELARLDGRLVQVVELKYFGGLKSEEIAAALGIAERSVRRDWQKARVLLHEELKP